MEVAKLTEKDDIEVYLVTFERLMHAYGIEKRWWALKQAPNKPMWRCAKKRCYSTPTQESDITAI